MSLVFFQVFVVLIITYIQDAYSQGGPHLDSNAESNDGNVDGCSNCHSLATCTTVTTGDTKTITCQCSSGLRGNGKFCAVQQTSTITPTRAGRPGRTGRRSRAPENPGKEGTYSSTATPVIHQNSSPTESIQPGSSNVQSPNITPSLPNTGRHSSTATPVLHQNSSLTESIQPSDSNVQSPNIAPSLPNTGRHSSTATPVIHQNSSPTESIQPGSSNVQSPNITPSLPNTGRHSFTATPVIHQNSSLTESTQPSGIDVQSPSVTPSLPNTGTHSSTAIPVIYQNSSLTESIQPSVQSPNVTPSLPNTGTHSSTANPVLHQNPSLTGSIQPSGSNVQSPNISPSLPNTGTYSSTTRPVIHQNSSPTESIQPGSSNIQSPNITPSLPNTGTHSSTANPVLHQNPSLTGSIQPSGSNVQSPNISPSLPNTGRHSSTANPVLHQNPSLTGSIQPSGSNVQSPNISRPSLPNTGRHSFTATPVIHQNSSLTESIQPGSSNVQSPNITPSLPNTGTYSSTTRPVIHQNSSPTESIQPGSSNIQSPNITPSLPNTGRHSFTATPVINQNSSLTESIQPSSSNVQSPNISPSLQNKGTHSSTATLVLHQNSSLIGSIQPSGSIVQYPNISSLSNKVVSSSIPGTNNRTGCSASAQCIKMGGGSCVCYCINVHKNYSGIDRCQDNDSFSLPDTNIYQAHKRPLMPDVLKQDDEKMFQASIERGIQISSSVQLSCNWFTRNVQASPFIISARRTLVERNSMTWSCRAGSLPPGLKLIEFEVTLSNITTARRQFGFIKVEKRNLVATITGGSEQLRSSKYSIRFNGSDSLDPALDPGIDENRHVGMKFEWSCGDGGTLLANVFSGNKIVVVPSEGAKKHAGVCSQALRSKRNATGRIAKLINPLQDHVYYISLVVREGGRQADFVQTVYAVDEDVLRVTVRCKYNCKQKVVSSHRFALNAICFPHCPANARFSWKLYKKGAESNESITVWHLNETLISLIATKITCNNIVFNADKLRENSSYWLTSDVKLPNGTRGWAAYRFKTAAKPSGGTCNGIQLDTTALGISLNVSCMGWADEHQPLIFEFYHVHMLDDGTSPHLLSHSVVPFSDVQLPEFTTGEAKIKAVISNSLGARTEHYFIVNVVQPSWMNRSNRGYAAFKHTEVLFDKYMNEGQTYKAWQLAHVMIQSIKFEREMSWMTNGLVKHLKQHIIQKLSTAKAADMQTVLQLSSVLKEVTADSDVSVSPESMGSALNLLRTWASVSKQRVKNKSVKDLALVRDSWEMLLHCSGNILYETAQAISSNVTERAKLKNLARRAVELNDRISEAEISTKLSGEKYSVLKTIHKTVFVGVHEVTDLSNWEFQEDETSITFPYMSQDIFGNASKVSFQVINYKVNPFAVHQADDEINSQVVSLVLKDETGQVVDVSNLPGEISLSVPLKKSGNKTAPPVETYAVPEVMTYRVLTTHHENISLRVSLALHRDVPFQVYVKYGSRPTKLDYDHFTTLDEGTCQNKTLLCNISHYVWFHVKRPGKYFIGLLQKLRGQGSGSGIVSPRNDVSSNNVRRGRIARSLQQMKDSDEELCVKLKELPTQQPRIQNNTLAMSQYAPEEIVNFTLEVDSAGCLYWSEDKEQWMGEGCKAGKNSTPTALQCLCNHLTSFGGYFLVTPNKIDFSQVQVGFKNIKDAADALVMATVMVVFLLYFIVLIFARRADKKDLGKISPMIHLPLTKDSVHRYKASITTGAWRNSGTSAKVSMVLYGTESSSSVIDLKLNLDNNRKTFNRGNTDNFLFAVAKPLGSLVKIQVGHDSSGVDPSWFLNEISITDIEANSRWNFPCYRWLALERDDGSTTLELDASNVKKGRDFKSEFNSARVSGLANDHLWFSVATKEPRNFFTRVQRVTCCCFLLLWGMLTSSMFYIGDANITPAIQIGPFKITVRELSVSIMTALIAFPPSFIVVFMFRKSRRLRVANDEGSDKRTFQLPHFFIYIAWFVCVVGSSMAGVVIIFYSLQWGGEKSQRWLSSIFLTAIEDVFVSQPVKIVIISVLLSLRFKHKRNQPDGDLSEEADSFDSGVSQQALFTVSKEEVERQRKYRITERKTNKFVRDIAFSCIFIILLMYVCYGDKSEHRYRMAKATRDAFVKLEKIRDKPHLWKWFNDILIPATFASEWYNGRKETVAEYIGNKRSILVGMPRLRQLRILKDSCDVPHQFVHSISSCYDFYCEDKEDKMGWDALSNKTSSKWSNISCPENWKYSSEEELGSQKRLGIHALYGGGGYTANLGYDGKIGGIILKDLVKNGWIDRQTRVVMVELSMFNTATRLLADVTLYFEMLPSGFLGKSMTIQVMPLTEKFFAYLVIFLLFAFVLGYYLVSECIRFYQLKYSYFGSMWNWLELLQVMSAILVVAFSIEKDIKTSKVLRQLKRNPFASVSFHDTFSWFEIEQHMICIASSVAVLRLLRLLKINKHVIVLLLAIKKSLRPLMSFIVVLFVVFVAYAHAGFLLFGKNVHKFASFDRVIMSLFHMSLGSPSPRSEMEQVDLILARLYSQSFALLVMIIMINMFVAILNEAQTESTSSAKDSNDMEVANLLLSKFFNLLGMKIKHSSTANRAEETPKEVSEREVFSLATDASEKETRQIEIPVTMDTDLTNTFTTTTKKDSATNNTRKPEPLGSFLTLDGYEMPSKSRSSIDGTSDSSEPLSRLRFSQKSFNGQSEPIDLSRSVSPQRYTIPSSIKRNSFDGQCEPARCFARSLFQDSCALPPTSQTSSYEKSKASKLYDEQNEPSGLLRHWRSPNGSTTSIASRKTLHEPRQSVECIHNSLSPDICAMSSMSWNSFDDQEESTNVHPANLSTRSLSLSSLFSNSFDVQSEPEHPRSFAAPDRRAGQSQELVPASQNFSSSKSSKKDSELIVEEDNLGSDNRRTVHFAGDVTVRQIDGLSAMDFLRSTPVDHPHLPNTPGKTSGSCDKTTDHDNASPSCNSEGIIAATQTSKSTHPASKKVRSKTIDFDEVSEWMNKANFSGNSDNAPLDGQTEGLNFAKQTSKSTNPASDSRKTLIDFDKVSEWMKKVNHSDVSTFQYNAVSKMMKKNRNTRKRRNTRKGKTNEMKTDQLENRARMLDRLLHVLDVWD